MKVNVTLFSNYDLWDDYCFSAYYDLLNEYGISEEEGREGFKVPDSEVWERIEELATDEWDDVKAKLAEYLNEKTIIATGTITRWNGNFAGGFIGTIEEILDGALKDCDFWELIDEGGHLKLRCSHHDGTNEFEIRVLTSQGETYYNNWQYGDDTRTTQHIHSQIVSHYSVIPHFSKNVYGTQEYTRKTA